MNNSLEDKVIVVGGGAKNLGGLICRDLAANGARAVVVHYHSNSTKADANETVNAVKELGAEAMAVQGDLTDVSKIRHLFSTAKEAYGGVDIAINTTGMVLKKPFTDISEAEYDTMFGINTKAAFFFIQEAGRSLNDGGKLLTLVTSLLGAFTPFYAAYAGAKAPIEHFTRAASKEFGERGISVTAVGPGPMDTPFFYPAEGEEAVAYHKTAAALSPFSKTGLTDIEDIVPFIRFLVTDGWWITGQTILANGGYTTK